MLCEYITSGFSKLVKWIENHRFYIQRVKEIKLVNSYGCLIWDKKEKISRKKEERKSCIVADAQHTCRQMIKFNLPTYLSSNDQIQPLGKLIFGLSLLHMARVAKSKLSFILWL